MLSFRYDINALRALAVTAVVLYHYKFAYVPGGYIGVDVFFVISGYLMTLVIVKRLANDTFSLFRFYLDRVNRIVPGLSILIVLILIFGYFYLDPVTYNKLGYSAVAALLFRSNYVFMSWIDYFVPDADTHWLLHTWSLSVEWQFYIIYPILLLLIYKWYVTRPYMQYFMYCIAIISFVYFIASCESDPSSAFYLLPQRAWELLAGGIVALHFKACPQRFSAAVSVAGFALIGACAFLFDPHMPWPDYHALLPVLGTCCVIAANRSEGFLIRNEIVQGIGSWSYSIYLWHWPIAVAFLYFDVIAPAGLLALCKLVVLAIVLSPAIFVSAMRRGRFVPKKPLFYGEPWSRSARFIAPFIVAFLLAHLVDSHGGYVNRRRAGPEQVQVYKTVLADWAFPQSCNGRDAAGHPKPCTLGRSEGPGVLIIGDSHAMQVFNRLVETTKSKPGFSATFLVSAGCPLAPEIRIVGDKGHCTGFFDEAIRVAEIMPLERLVLVSAWHVHFTPKNDTICFVQGNRCSVERDPERYYQRLDETLAALGTRLIELRRRGVEIVIVASTPVSDWDVPTELLKRQFLGIDTKEVESIDREKFTKSSFPVNSRMRSLAASIGARFVDPVDFLCGPQTCPTVDEHEVPYLHDKGHYRAGAVRAERFRFYDDALGIEGE